MAAVFWDQKDIAVVARCPMELVWAGGLWRGAAPCPMVWLGCEEQ